MNFDLDDRVVDIDQHEDQRSAGRVVDVPGATAAEQRVQGTGKTVADFNPDHPPDAPVVGIQFERAGGEIGGQTYHYPTTRLEPIDEDWEPTEAASKGQCERQQIIDDHPEAVAAFADAARDLFTDPAGAADRLSEDLTVGPPATEAVTNAEAIMADLAHPGERTVEPETGEGTQTVETREECRYTRDDQYRPDDEDAIVCWECSTKPGNRPNKLQRDEPPGGHCVPTRGPSPWRVEQQVRESVDLSGLDDAVRRSYDGRESYVLRDIAALRSGEDDRIRRTALRLAYDAHLADVEDYNYSRALALLRDIGAAADLPIIGDGDGDGDGDGAENGGASA